MHEVKTLNRIIYEIVMLCLSFPISVSYASGISCINRMCYPTFIVRIFIWIQENSKGSVRYKTEY